MTKLAVHPIMSFIDNIHVKAVVAALLQIFFNIFETLLGIGDIYQILLESPQRLIVLVISLTFIDFVTGIIKAIKLKLPIKSWEMRKTILKVLEYVIFLSVIIMFTNAFGNDDTLDFISEKVKIFAFFLIAVIEINSIVENLSNTTISSSWKTIKEKFNLGKFKKKDEK